MKVQSEVMIAELQRFIAEGKSVILPVSGRSMLPFIVGDRDKVEFYPLKDELHKGDVVMAKVDEGYYVVHRVVRIDGDCVVLEGDGNLGFQEHCTKANVIAQGLYVIDKQGRKRSLTSPVAMKRWKLWMALKPLRRVLLKFVKILFLMKDK